MREVFGFCGETSRILNKKNPEVIRLLFLWNLDSPEYPLLQSSNATGEKRIRRVFANNLRARGNRVEIERMISFVRKCGSQNSRS